MELPRKLKNVIAGTLIAAGVLTPVAMFVGEAWSSGDPRLGFRGVTLSTKSDGSVQAVFEVSVKSQDYCAGVSFFLEYQDTYLTPSKYTDNTALAGGSGLVDEDGFFQVDADLYGGDNPFTLLQESLVGSWPAKTYSAWDEENDLIAMNLTLGQTRLEEKGKLKPVEIGGQEEIYYVFHSGEEGRPEGATEDQEVVLGYLSFDVKPEYLPLVQSRFDLVDGTSATVGGDYLIRVRDSAYKKTYEPWQINYIDYAEDPRNRENTNYAASHPGPASLYYKFDFPLTLIDLQATEREVTVDAYQAYTDGTLSDVAAILRKYSPMATLTYSNGTRGHQVIPWGLPDESEATGRKYDFKVCQYDQNVGFDEATGLYEGTEVTDYDPTHGDYIVQQYCYYTLENEDGTKTEYRSTRPVTVHLTVTPIHLLGVSADDLYKTYALDESLLNSVRAVADLRLPTRARLQTDIPVDGASLLINIPGWESVNTLSWSTSVDLDQLVADGAATADHHWPTAADSGNIAAVQVDRVGTYSFSLADSMGGTAKPIAAADIRTQFPWLTVPDGDYDLTAARVVTGVSHTTPATNYKVSALTTTVDAATGDPVMTLQIVRDGGAPMADGSKFRVLMPDGSQMGIGNGNAGAASGWDMWFENAAYDQQNYSSYSAAKQTTGEANGGFHLVTDPGTLDAADTYAARRLALRRQINLGGTFFVAINENPEDPDQAWSDYIPVYVRPRDNQYIENKVYNFIGDNAGVYQYPGTLGTTITVPQGDYNVVDNTGKSIFVDGAGADTTDRADNAGNLYQAKTEPFGVATTYDGTTGAEPGRLYTFRVEDTGWAPPQVENGTVYKYGQSKFVDTIPYNAYGQVTNPDDHTATVRTPKEDPHTQVEAVRLIYVGEGNVSSDPGTGNVILATYDAQKAGYATRQDYTFIIENIGDTVLYDLGIDSWTDNADSRYDGGGGHFEMLKKPASYLAPGQSTTFTLTYVYDLPARSGTGNLDYTDTLFLTSSNRHRTGDGATAGVDYLLDFDATFLVSKDDLFRVTVNYDPASGAMGTAGTILGPRDVSVDGNVVQIMNLTPGSTTFPKDQWVYVVVSPVDEYVLDSITAKTASGHVMTSTDDQWDLYDTDAGASLPEGANEGTKVYWFPMPAEDVVIDVVFKEDLSSKLRLSDLRVYADRMESNVTQDPGDSEEDDLTNRAPYLRRLFQKSFTDAEKATADGYPASHNRSSGEYLMQAGRAAKEGFDSKVDQYLVVIPYDADFSQVTAKLREVVMPADAPAGINVFVAMDLFGTDTALERSILTQESGSTNGPDGPTVHYSNVFASPAKGYSKYVRIRISYDGGGTGAQISPRYYYVEIHRETDSLEAVLNYGNSPYGMIMNDAGISAEIPDGETTSPKQDAKAAFDANHYRFSGMADELIPAAVTGHGLTDVFYNTEAWVKVVGSKYEPESYTDLGDYIRANNMDVNDYALFVYGSGSTLKNSLPEAQAFTEPGIAVKDGVYQIWDSSGRPVDIDRVSRYVEVQTLDLTAASQTGRFDLPDADAAARTVRIPFSGNGAAHDIAAGWTEIPVQERNADGTLKYDAAGLPVYQAKLGAGGVPETNGDGNPVYETETVYVRPGVYKLVYLYTDYDGALPTTAERIARLPGRPLIILARNGDVNADGQILSGTAAAPNDEELLKGRVTEPLGYTAEHYTDFNVFRNRVCDVNNDRNVNNIDANELSRSTLLEFYLATDYGFTANDPTPPGP